MSRRRHIVIVTLLALPGAVACAAGDPGPSDGCQTDDDCKDNRVCQSGTCVEAVTPPSGTMPSGTMPSGTMPNATPNTMSSSASSGGGAPSCDGSGSCMTCGACAIDGACQSQGAACESNSECIQLFECVGPCTSAACVTGCANAHASGYDDALSFIDCLYCNVCHTDCDGSVVCSGGHAKM